MQGRATAYQRTVELLALGVEEAEPAPHLKQTLLARARREVPRVEEVGASEGWWQRQVATFRHLPLGRAVAITLLFLIVSIVALERWATMGRGSAYR